MFALTYTSPDSGCEIDAVSEDIEKLKAKAVENNGDEPLNWINYEDHRFEAYVEVGDEEFDENGETSCFYVIEEVDLI